MSDHVTTNYRRDGYADTDDIVLSTTPTTRVVFRGGVHSGGVRGRIIRQKIGEGGRWADVHDVDFRRMPPDSGVEIELDTAAVRKLRSHLDQLAAISDSGVQTGRTELVVAPEDEVVRVTDGNRRRVLEQILQSGHADELLQMLERREPTAVQTFAHEAVARSRAAAIAEYERALDTHPRDEGFWQTFFTSHPWMLQSAFSAPVFMLHGETYVGGKLSQGRNGIGGVATDFLFSDDSTKSFSVVEIKTPGTGLVGGQYRGDDDSGHDNETYSMHADLSGAVVQIRNQIAVAVEQFQAVLGREHKDLNAVHPRGVLVIGSSVGLSERRKASLNHFRHGLFSLSVVTYDELLTRLKALFLDESPSRAS